MSSPLAGFRRGTDQGCGSRAIGGSTVLRLLVATAIAAILEAALFAGVPKKFGPYTVWGLPWQYGACSLRGPREAVRGFPIILRLDLGNTAEYSTSVSLFDLAGAARGDRFWCYFVNGVRSYDFGRLAAPGEPVRSREDTPAQVRIRPGETASFWFDITRALQASNERERRRGYRIGPRVELQPGSWDLAVELDKLGMGPVALAIREPNADEEYFRRLSGAAQLGDSWFPEVVLRPLWDPPAVRLDPELQRVVALVKILRAGVRSAEGSLDAIRQRNVGDWGELAGLLRLIKLECMYNASSAPDTLVPPPATTALELRLVREGLGPLAQFNAQRRP